MARSHRDGAWRAFPLLSGIAWVPRWPARLGGLQAALIVLGGFLFFRKSSHYLLWLSLPLIVPALRCLWPAERRRTLDTLRQLGISLAAFPARSESLPWHAAFIWVVGPAFFLFLVNQRTLTNGDTWPVVPTAARLISTGTGCLDEAAAHAPAVYGRPLPYSVLRTDAGVWSAYPSGMVPFVVPLATLARLCGADIERATVQQRLEKWTAAGLAAMTLGLFFLLALHLAPAGPAWVTTGLLAVGSVVTSTCSQALWQQGGVLFWMLVVLLAEFRNDRRPFAGCPALQGIAGGMMLACRLSALLFLLAFGVWLLWRTPRRALATAGIGMLAYLPWVVFHLAIYGNPFGPSTGQFAGHYWDTNLLDGLAGLLVSPGRGLFVYQPWLVLSLPGWFLLRSQRRITPAGWAGMCLAAIGLHLLLVANWRIWWGGHCWGSRLLAEVVLLAALLAVPAVAGLVSIRGGRCVLVGVALLSFLPHAPVLFGDALRWNQWSDQRPELFWSWREAPFLYPFQARH